MAANTVEGEDTTNRLIDAIQLSAAFALIKFVLQVVANVWQAHLGWGYFADEPYYILCGQKLAWGYVDHGPVVALQARLAVSLFGTSLAGIRMFSALAGAAKVFLTGLLAWEMGADRTGQALGMLGVLIAGSFLALDSYLSMNSFEPVFWMTAVWAVLRILKGGSLRWWVILGVASGLGMENKPSMLIFLAALSAGLLVTPQRRILFTQGFWIAAGLAFLLFLPNLLWQFHHDWATLRFLHRGKTLHKNAVPGPLSFLFTQAYLLGPENLFLWGGGLLWLLLNKAARRFRFLGWTYFFFLGLMMASRDANSYYLAPIYPMLFAAGGRVAELLTRSRRWRWTVPVYAVLVIVVGCLAMPMALPILTPTSMVAYARRTHMVNTATQITTHKTGEAPSPLPQFYADRFGWQELADTVTRIYQGLPPADRVKAGILCMDYEEASAINFLGAGRGLPFAISPHNNYFLWGPHGETGAVTIVVSSVATREQLLQSYASVEAIGKMDVSYSMPVEHATIFLCRGRKWPIQSDWKALRTYL